MPSNKRCGVFYLVIVEPSFIMTLFVVTITKLNGHSLLTKNLFFIFFFLFFFGGNSSSGITEKKRIEANRSEWERIGANVVSLIAPTRLNKQEKKPCTCAIRRENGSQRHLRRSRTSIKSRVPLESPFIRAGQFGKVLESPKKNHDLTKLTRKRICRS